MPCRSSWIAAIVAGGYLTCVPAATRGPESAAPEPADVPRAEVDPGPSPTPAPPAPLDEPELYTELAASYGCSLSPPYFERLEVRWVLAHMDECAPLLVEIAEGRRRGVPELAKQLLAAGGVTEPWGG